MSTLAAILVVTVMTNGAPTAEHRFGAGTNDCQIEMAIIEGVNQAQSRANTNIRFVARCESQSQNTTSNTSTMSSR